MMIGLELWPVNEEGLGWGKGLTLRGAQQVRVKRHSKALRVAGRSKSPHGPLQVSRIVCLLLTHR